MWNVVFVLFSYFCSIFLSLSTNFYKNREGKLLFGFIIFILIICVTFRDGKTLNDYENYVHMLYATNNTEIGEPTFYLIKNISRIIGGAYMMFFIYAILGISIKSIAIVKLSKLPYLALCIYISNILILHDMTQIRAGVASGIFLLSIPYLRDKKIIKYICLIILATSFHYSAILFFMCCIIWIPKLYNSNKFLWLVIPTCYIFSGFVFDISLIPFEALRTKLEVYKKLQENGTEGFTELNIYNPYILFRIGLYYFLLYKYKLIKNQDCNFKTLMFIEAIAISIFPLFAFIPILGYRGSELIGIVEVILYPLIIYCFKPRILGLSFVYIISSLLLIVNLTYKSLIKI